MKKKYYKGFNQNLCCRDFQYEIGKTYKINEDPILCQRGFHFCDTIADVYKFYDMSTATRVCEIEPLGEIVKDKDGFKYVTNEIKIVKEVKNPQEFTNINKSSKGYFNTGDYNSGNSNSGNNNMGNNNSGSSNSGDENSGNYNSGDCNAGDCNAGDWNCGSGNSGVFNTSEEPKIKMFNKESNWTYNDWHKSRAYYIMMNCPHSHSKFISGDIMTYKEKKEHPEYKIIGGYVKECIVTNKDSQKWWNTLDDADKQEVLSLPNFDAKIFKKCTGIDV